MQQFEFGGNDVLPMLAVPWACAFGAQCMAWRRIFLGAFLEFVKTMPPSRRLL
jgi:hypothetical protein